MVLSKYPYPGIETNKCNNNLLVPSCSLETSGLLNISQTPKTLGPPVLSFKHACQPSASPLPNAFSSCGLGGGYHASECRQGFGTGPEAFRIGWQSGRSSGRSLTVWKLCSQAKEQVLVEELQGGYIGVGPVAGPSSLREIPSIAFAY